MEEFSIIFTVILLIFGVLQIILFFKIWGMCNNIADIQERFKNACPTKEEKRAIELMEKQQKTIVDTNTTADVVNATGFNIGDNVIYEPMDRKMIVKEITRDGMLVCISYKKNGSEEYEGTYKPEQVKKL